MGGEIPLYRYTITLDTGTDLPPVDAVGYQQDGPWTVFDDLTGTVLSRRTSSITEVRRSPLPVATQETTTP